MNPEQQQQQPLDEASIAAMRVLVADPNAVVRDGMRAFLECESDLEYVGGVGDVQWLMWALRVVEPDLLVVDCLLPGGELAATVEYVREQRPQTRIVALGSGPWLESAACEAGADSFVSKGQPPDVLRAALKVMRVERAEPSSMRPGRRRPRSIRQADSQPLAPCGRSADGQDRPRSSFAVVAHTCPTCARHRNIRSRRAA